MTSCGDMMSALMAWVASAICSPKVTPGNESRRRPANQGDVELSSVTAVSLKFL